VALPAMGTGQDVIEDHDSMRLSLRTHPLELLSDRHGSGERPGAEERRRSGHHPAAPAESWQTKEERIPLSSGPQKGGSSRA